MRKPWTFDTPRDASRPKGPKRARDEAIALLAPFKFSPARRPGLDPTELLSIDPVVLAAAGVENLAEDFNALQYRAKHAPRSKEIKGKLERLRKKLQNICSELDALDDWTRLHLQDLSEPGLAPGLLSTGAPDRGKVADIVSKFVGHVESAMLRLPPDRGGRQNHDEHFLGTAKTRFVRQAFDLFDSYHRGSASSTEGSPFHTFTHRVYEYATGEHDEDRAALSHKIRSLITPLHQYRMADAGFWAIEEKLNGVAPDDPGGAIFRRQQYEFEKQKQALEPIFVPALERIAKRQPRGKNRK